jgi:ribosome-binding protein aMBF1 (putative translation factor)
MIDEDTPRGPGLTTKQLLARLEELDPGLRERVDETVKRAGSVGNALFSARVRAQLSQVELSRRSGVRQSDISDIENGRGNPTKRTLEKLGVALGIDFVIGASSASSAA